MRDKRGQQAEIEDWLRGQKQIPGRKEIRRMFPNTPLKVVRAALQSVRDTEGGQ